MKNKCEMVLRKYLIIFSFFVTFSNPLIPIAYAEEWVAACEEIIHLTIILKMVKL